MAEVVSLEGGPILGRVTDLAEFPQMLADLGLPSGRPVLVSVGGAGGMEPQLIEAVAQFLKDHVLPVLDRLDALVVDGGTDAGVMRAMGRAVQSTGSRIPLIGVAPEGTVVLPGAATAEGLAAIEPNHSHVILVPGSDWGDESPWLADVATRLAGKAASVTLVINGGDITYSDVAHSIRRGRPVIVVSGTGRTADEIAEAAAGQGTHDRAAALLATAEVLVVQFSGEGGIAEAVAGSLMP